MNKVIRFKFKFNFGAASLVGICFHQLSWQIQRDRKEIWNLTFGAQFIRAKEWWAVCGITRTIDLIHDTRHLLHALWDQWDKSYITWYFRGQTSDKICQYEKSRSSLFILSKRDDYFIVMQNVCHKDISGRYCIYCKITMITSTCILTLSSLRWKGFHFLLSRINKLSRDFFHCQCFLLVGPLKNQQPHPQGWRVSWIRYI